MRIVVSAQGDTLESPTSPVFGRCPTYVFVDTETVSFEAAPNPAMNQGGGRWHPGGSVRGRARRANVVAHAGMGGGDGSGAGRGMGMRNGGQPTAPAEEELAQLRDTLKSLRQQLAETMERIEQLEKEG